MLSYHNSEELKQKYVRRMQDHIAADELVRGTGYENGRGCAVGCTLNKYDHKAFEDELGIPEWMARLIDKIHEGASTDIWPTFAKDFLTAVPVGKDLSVLKSPVHIFILNLNKTRVNCLEYLPESVRLEVLSAIEQCIELHKGKFSESTARSAQSAARSAQSAAESARSTAKSAARSTAWSPAWSAADSAAWSAKSAVRSAESAAWSAEATAVRSAESAAWSAEATAWSIESAVRSAKSAVRSAEATAWSAESAVRSAESAAWSAVSAAWSAESAAEAAAEHDLIANELLRLLRGLSNA